MIYMGPLGRNSETLIKYFDVSQFHPRAPILMPVLAYHFLLEVSSLMCYNIGSGYGRVN